MAGQASDIEKELSSLTFPPHIQQKVIKVIIATNMAETSITITSLVVLIDSGMFKEAVWDEVKEI